MGQLVAMETEEMVLCQLRPQTSMHTAWHNGDGEAFENNGEAYLNKEYKEKR